MAKQLDGKALVSHINKLAFGKANDAVKLVFLDPENRAEIEKLDLSMVAEVKRGSGGAVEVKLINRIALMELLARLLEPQNAEQSPQNGVESFYSAMDKAAAMLGESKDEV